MCYKGEKKHLIVQNKATMLHSIILVMNEGCFTLVYSIYSNASESLHELNLR